MPILLQLKSDVNYLIVNKLKTILKQTKNFLPLSDFFTDFSLNPLRHKGYSVFFKLLASVNALEM